ncbi:MAG: winged helix-turn-helix domain-containing protein, partial [Myxococcales bacterium]|nr:winged helix-turn-helix domain-containing protein [Myxococcales bacterium]
MARPTPTSTAQGRLILDVGHADPKRRMVVRDGVEVPLTRREAQLLAYLAAQRPRAVPVGELLEEVCGLRADTATHTVQTAIYTLRRKIERVPRHPRHLLLAATRAYTFVEAEWRGTHAVLTTVELLAGVDSRSAAAVIETLLASGTPLSHAERVQLSVVLGGIAQRRGDLSTARRAVANLSGVPERMRARGHLVRAMVAYRRGDTAVADSECATARTALMDGGRAEAIWTFHDTMTLTTDPVDACAFDGPVAVLTDTFTASAAEVFTLAMRAQPGVTIVGEPSMGAFSDGVNRELPNGWVYGIAIGDWRDGNDVSFEGQGVPVDVAALDDGADLGWLEQVAQHHLQVTEVELAESL